MSETSEIPGADQLIAWFGHWPTFHDAEVLSITLDRSRGSQVVLHAFERTSELDARGYYVLAKHAVVTFSLEGFPLDEEGVTNTQINYFNHQNVLGSAWVEKNPKGYLLRLAGIFGVDASLSCERLSVTVQPGNPDNDPRWSRQDRLTEAKKSNRELAYLGEHTLPFSIEILDLINRNKCSKSKTTSPSKL